MSRLFDKFLVSAISQRIPMPGTWQTTLGLQLTSTTQTILGSDGATEEKAGYMFGRDDATIDRGFVTSRILSDKLNQETKYRILIYLQALKEYLGKDFISYFSPATTVLKGSKYITTCPAIEGQPYTIYAKTELPIIWTYYSEAEPNTHFASEEVSVSINPYVLDTSKYTRLTVYNGSEQEYFMIKVESYSPVIILQGRFNRFNTGNNVLGSIQQSNNPFTSSKAVITQYQQPLPLSLPSLMNGGEYSDKLISSLLGITITDDSSDELKQQTSLSLREFFGANLDQQVELNTLGIYDVDKYIGKGVIW